jgi:hypothetical protein
MTNAIDKILGATARQTAEPVEYRALVESGGRPQMSFSVTHANGDMDGFMYHSLDSLRFQVRNGLEFVSFTHRATAVTMQGERMKVIFRAITRHTAMELHVQDGRPAEKDQPVITRLEVTTAGQQGPAVRVVK